MRKLLDEMSARQVLKKLRSAGCEVVRQKGSHAQVKCPPNNQTTVPVHGSRDIKKGTLKAIEKSVGIDLDGDGRPPRKRRYESLQDVIDLLP